MWKLCHKMPCQVTYCLCHLSSAPFQVAQGASSILKGQQQGHLQPGRLGNQSRHSHHCIVALDLIPGCLSSIASQARSRFRQMQSPSLTVGRADTLQRCRAGQTAPCLKSCQLVQVFPGGHMRAAARHGLPTISAYSSSTA